MKIRILQIGKDGKLAGVLIDEYVKRLRPYVDLEVLSLKEVVASKSFPEKRCVEEEGKIILKRLVDDEYVVALDEGGRQMKSVEFSKFLEKYKDLGQTITFVIGGPYGLSEGVKKRADTLLSLSKMTFTYQIARILILEQIYRALSILHGKRYHNE